jgi:hypothetical protein
MIAYIQRLIDKTDPAQAHTAITIFVVLVMAITVMLNSLIFERITNGYRYLPE